MSYVTTWGYDLTEMNDLPDLLTMEEFNDFTAGKYASDGRVAGNISAASSAVREYCGWHVYPPAACKLTDRILYGNGRIKRVGCDLVIQLPATFVASVESVSIDDVATDDYYLSRNGILTVFGGAANARNRRTQVEVEYTAGVDSTTLIGVKELIAHRVTHALASSEGVQSETAGGVSITYSANWINSARATALADDNKEVIAPFRVRSVF